MNYFVDWTDLNGISNPSARTRLREGRYQVFVYDSLFCKDTLTNLLIKKQCPGRDTFHLLVVAGASNSFCISPATGFLSGETAFQLLSGNTSFYGNWSINGNCLIYNALNTKGFNVDLICIQSLTPGLMAVDTICIQVSIVASSTAETVYFTTQVNTAITACGTVPPAVQNRKSLPLNIPAFSGFSAFGDYHLNPSTGCITYTSFDVPQFFADSIALAVCDSIIFKCHTISYVPSVLPYHDCSMGIIREDTLSLPAVQCTTGTTACLHIPYADILNYTIIDNAVPYVLGASGCFDGTVTGYNIIQLPMALIQNNGPYFLDKWQINGVSYSDGLFGNIMELVVLMNQIDPSPGWYFDNQTKIIGGSSTNNYGYLKVTNTGNLTGIAEPLIQSSPMGSTLQFSIGAHIVILKKIQTGCADTLLVNVYCADCPPIHTYPADVSGNIQWDTYLCSGDSLFSTNLPINTLSEWVILDKGIPFTQIVPQGNTAALQLDTGVHLLHLRNTVSTCVYQFFVNIICVDSGNRMVIYTGISPNGDGKNDFWYIAGIDLFPRNEVGVYNRSGNAVFHQKGYDNQWAGTWNGKLLPDSGYTLWIPVMAVHC